MKRSRVIVPWPEGLHLRPAAKLVRVVQGFRSRVVLKCGDRIADVRSIVNLIALCATLGMSLDLEVVGEDEQDAVAAVEQVFAGADTEAGASGGQPIRGG
ncbi:MAG TPA: HPr family phosphocarrier protein [Opitutaceae bacterium]